jgi:hypothetical protein
LQIGCRGRCRGHLKHGVVTKNQVQDVLGLERNQRLRNGPAAGSQKQRQRQQKTVNSDVQLFSKWRGLRAQKASPRRKIDPLTTV